ncbi:hypothetical protein K523DRAFT_97084 [Schizophyllum commune Tattone D]|nr:hypothetical protein K523DRAFT_97084 [Schizophyllum commune Tattone D]
MVARQLRITRDGRRAVTENEQCTPSWAVLSLPERLEFFALDRTISMHSSYAVLRSESCS